MPSRYELIAQWANQQNWRRGAELGLFDGRTYLYLLEHCPKLTLIGVDVWDCVPGFEEGATKSGERCFCAYCSETRSSRKREATPAMRKRVIRQSAPYGQRSLIYMQPTTDVANLVNEPLDFVFVDADHSTEGVSADIAAWRGKIRAGGRMIGHDYNMASVRAAVGRAFGDVNLADDHVWWAQC